MNLESPSSASSGPPQLNQRKERGAIAVQACETCRARKQKCDEARPKCSGCQRMKLECRYREPQPTKKDKTMVEILDRVKGLEAKIDRLTPRPLLPPGFGSHQPTVSSQPSSSTDVASTYASDSLRASQKSGSGGSSTKNAPEKHVPAVHRMLRWPSIQRLLRDTVPTGTEDVDLLNTEGAAFIVRLQRDAPVLPMDDALPYRPFMGMQMQATRTAGGERVTFPDLTYDMMLRMSTTYFDTFNMMYPFMDRQSFLSDTLAKVNSEGFDSDPDSVIALLVLALGQLADDGAYGTPINNYRGRPSGVRGGSLERPPGLILFNEARKRMGFVLTECDLGNVQIYTLAALYYESCSRHVEFWRLSSFASQACAILITCNNIEWSSQRGELIKRVFWHCNYVENYLDMELDVPPTGLRNLEDLVGPPKFSSSFSDADIHGDQASKYQAHYTASISFRRLCIQLNTELNYSMSTVDTSSTSAREFDGPSAAAVEALSKRLDSWRKSLPLDLQWPEEDPTAFPIAAQMSQSFSNAVDTAFKPPQQSQPGQTLFSTDLDQDAPQYQYLYDIQVAVLRTSYYYAKYMVHRPLLYKALHFPNDMTQEDAEGVAACLQACMRWPLILSPPARRKRLIPYLFVWSQNILTILVIFHMTRHTPIMQTIRAQFCGPNFDTEVEETTDLMLDWVRDLKSMDPAVRWCYNLLQGMYRFEN